MILRVLRALPGAARELAADLRRALVIDDEALVQWLRAEELADQLREADARARRAEQERDEARSEARAANAEIDALDGALCSLIETYDGATGDVRGAEDAAAAFGYSLPLQELAGRLLASERVNPLRRELRVARAEIATLRASRPQVDGPIVRKREACS